MSVAEFETDGTIRHVNEKFLNSVGYEEKRISGRHHSLLCSEDYAASLNYQHFWEQLRAGIPSYGSFEYLRQDGSKVWFESTYAPIVDEQGSVERVIEFGRDVTEINRQRSQLISVLKAIDTHQVVFEYDTGGMITSVNQLGLEASGYSLEELVGKHRVVLMDPDHEVAFHADWKRVLNGDSVRGQLPRRKKNGEAFWLELTLIPICNEREEIVSVMGIGSDVTNLRNERVQTQGELAAIGESQLMAEFNLDGTFRSANMLYCVTMGVEESEILGVPHAQFLMDPSLDKKIWADLGEGEAVLGTFVCKDSEGNKVWLEGAFNPIFGVDGKLEKVVQYSQNLTAQKLDEFEAVGKLNAISRSHIVVEYSLDGEILKTNELFTECFGYESGELNGSKMGVLYGEEFLNSEIFRETWDRVMAGESLQRVWRRNTKKGECVWLRSQLVPILGDMTETLKVVEFSKDITEEVLRNENFSKQLQKTSAALSEVTDVLRSASSELSGDATETKQRSGSVVERSGLMKENLFSTSQAASEMNASIRGVAKEVAESRSLILSAVDMMKETSAIIEELAKEGVDIGEVTTGIGKIASQTNLLALNASIEASRAGQFGRGFAVVADEVKELARETSKATDDIGERVKLIQNRTGQAQLVAERLKEAIHLISESSSSIATAVDEQSATTNEVSRCTDEVGEWAAKALGDISSIAGLVDNTEAISKRLFSSVEQLRRETETLSELAESCEEVPS